MTPRLGEVLGSPPWADFTGARSMKFVSAGFALRNSPSWVETALCAMGPLNGLVDVKYWPILKVGETPALPHWHYDCYESGVSGAGREVEMALYVCGAGSRTRFMVDGAEWAVPEGQIVHYTSRDLHRAAPAEFDGPRLLVRVAWGYDIRPRERFFEPTVTVL